MHLYVDIYIVNPDGCVGDPNNPDDGTCPQYDGKIEYIKAWVDWNGDEIWDTPGEKVLDKGMNWFKRNYTGLMSYDKPVILDQYDPVANPNPLMRVTLVWNEDINDPCEPDQWEWGDVKDLPLQLEHYAVRQLTVESGNTIRELGDLPNTIWEEVFVANCERDIIIGDDHYDERPFSVASSTDENKTVAALRATITPCEGGGDIPSVSAEWTVTSQTGDPSPVVEELSPVQSWELDLNVSAPRMIGIYDVDFEFKVETEFGPRATLPIKRKMLVTKNPSFKRGWPNQEEWPKLNWYETACGWAGEADDVAGASTGIRNSIYASGWDYGQWPITNAYCSWYELIDEDEACRYWPPGVDWEFASCHQFSDVLFNLCRVLGWRAPFTKTVVYGNHRRGFVTPKGWASLDPDLPGTAGPPGSDPSDFDRYKFQNHSLLKLGDTEYHDATLNETHEDTADVKEWNINNSSPSFSTDEGALVWIFDENYFYYNWKPHWYTTEPPCCWQDENQNWRCENLTVEECDNLGGTVMISCDDCPPQFLLAGGESTTRVGRRVAVGTASWNRELFFTGDTVYELIDEDSNGIAEALAVDAECEIHEEGDFLVTGVLNKGDSFITMIPRAETSIISSDYLEGSPGIYTAHLEFAGEEIYHQGHDGPYDLLLYAYDSTAVIDTLQTSTPSYSHLDFGEHMATLISSSEEVLDLDSDEDYDILRIAVTVFGRYPGNFGVGGGIFADSILIATTGVDTFIVPGSHLVNLDFPGTSIRKSGLDGPYFVGLSLTDGEASIISSLDHTTLPYLAEDFDRSFLTPNGEYTDMPLDLDEDGDYDILRVSIEVDSEGSQLVTLRGWLAELGRPAEEFGPTITISRDSVLLVPGVQTLDLNFQGSHISRRGADGPYVLTFVEAFDESLEVVDHLTLGYQTQAYLASEFETGPPVLSYLGSFTEAAIDTTDPENGLADILEVAIEVESSQDALLFASASLYDKNGRFIVSGEGMLDVSGGEPIYLPIRFDGRYIFGNLRNGPYDVRDLYLYHRDDVAGGLRIDDVLRTSIYDNEDFEPAAVIAGILQSGPHVPAVDARVRSEEFVDFTDENGWYRLIYLTDDTTTVRASYEEISDWTVVLNGEFIHIGDSVDVEVAVGEIDELVFLKVDPSDLPDSDILATLEPGLHGNAPNPFSLSTEIMFVIPRAKESVHVRLRIYDPAGRLVRTLIDELRGPGVYRVRWDGRNDNGEAVNAGVYFYRLHWNGKTETDRMILVK